MASASTLKVHTCAVAGLVSWETAAKAASVSIKRNVEAFSEVIKLRQFTFLYFSIIILFFLPSFQRY